MKIVKVLLASLVLFMVTACGSDEKSDGKSITFALWDEAQVEGFKEIASNFKEETGVEVKIEVTPYGSYFTSLESAAEGGNLPDVFTINAPNFVKFADAGFLMDQTDFDYNLDEFVKPVADIYNYDGAQYALPRDYDGIGLWYNKEIFAELGLSVPTTWEELTATATIIKEKKPEVYPLIIPTADSQAGYWNLVVQNGGEIITKDGKSGWNSPEAIEAMEFYNSLVAQGLQPDPIKVGDSNTLDLLGSGKLAMAYDGTWSASAVKEMSTLDKFEVAPLPKKSGSDVSSVIHGVGTAISKDSKNAEAAQKFVEYLATDEANKILAKSVGVLPAKIGFGDALYEAVPSLTGLKATVDSAQNGVAYFKADVTGWDSEEKTIIENMLLGKTTPKKACEDMETEANKVLEQ